MEQRSKPFHDIAGQLYEKMGSQECFVQRIFVKLVQRRYILSECDLCNVLAWLGSARDASDAIAAKGSFTGVPAYLYWTQVPMGLSDFQPTVFWQFELFGLFTIRKNSIGYSIVQIISWPSLHICIEIIANDYIVLYGGFIHYLC